jgi:deoxyribose-phosphate aldolase
VGPNIGIEASGGIRSAPDALAMIAAGATWVQAAVWPSSANAGKQARIVLGAPHSQIEGIPASWRRS